MSPTKAASPEKKWQAWRMVALGSGGGWPEQNGGGCEAEGGGGAGGVGEGGGGDLRYPCGRTATLDRTHVAAPCRCSGAPAPQATAQPAGLLLPHTASSCTREEHAHVDTCQRREKHVDSKLPRA